MVLIEAQGLQNHQSSGLILPSAPQTVSPVHPYYSQVSTQLEWKSSFRQLESSRQDHFVL